jgi:hypothetical protein
MRQTGHSTRTASPCPRLADMLVLWIVVGVVVGSLLVLALVASGTVGRLPELRRAQRRIQRLREDADKLRPKIEDLQATMGLLQVRSARTTEHIAALRAARSGGPGDTGH